MNITSTVIFAFAAAITVFGGEQQELFIEATKETKALIVRTGPEHPRRFAVIKYLFSSTESEEIQEFRSMIELVDPEPIFEDGEEIIQLMSFCASSYVFEFHQNDGTVSIFGLTNCESDLRSRSLTKADVALLPESKDRLLAYIDQLEIEWQMYEDWLEEEEKAKNEAPNK